MKTMEEWEAETADPELLRRCKEAVRRVVPDADVILYGSRARGDAQDEYSDYDLLVLTDSEDTVDVEERARGALFPLEVETGAILTIIVYNRQEWNTEFHRQMPLHENIDQEGVSL
jgi:predicted nucleotidyltransferase